jgi:hypothetical protein
LVVLSVALAGCGRANFDPIAPRDGGLDILDAIDAFDSSLIGYWSFDEMAGTSAADTSGNGNAGVLTNGPSWVAGRVNGALDFDGIDDLVFVGNPAILDLTSSFSFVAWVLPRTLGGQGRARIVDKNNNTTGYTVRLDATHATSAFGAERDTGLGADIAVSDPNVIVLNTWQHLALVYDATDARIPRRSACRNGFVPRPAERQQRSVCDR